MNDIVGIKSLPRASGSSVRGRLLGGTAANLLDKIVLLAVQLASIPVLTRAWGPEGYGAWLMLMTIPAYLMVGDLGLSAAVQVQIGRLVAAGRRDAALVAFQSAWALSSAVSGILVVVAAGYAGVTWAESLIGPVDLTIPGVILLATFVAVGSLQSNLLLAAYRATGKYPLGAVLNTGIVAGQGVAVLASAAAGGGLIAAAAAQVAVGAAGFGILHLSLRQREPWLRLGVRHARRETLLALLHPSAAALALAIATALSLQGMVLVVGLAAGAGVAATFATARFLSRIPLQFAGLVTRASVPELMRSQALGDRALTRRLNVINVAATVLATLPFTAASWFVGPPLLAWMSHGTLSAEPMVFLLLGLAGMLSALSGAASAPIIATNRQGAFSYWYLGLITASLAVPFAGAPTLVIAAAAMAAAELVNLGVVLRALRTRV